MNPPRSPSLAQRLQERLPGINRFVAARFSRETALGLELTVALSLIALFLWAFVALADEFPEHGDLQTIDREFVGWMHLHQTPNGESLAAAISWFGYQGLIVLGVVMPIFFAARRERLRVIACLAGAIGVAGLNNVLKLAYRRVRPEFAAEYLQRMSWSFPSGHAMASLVIYGLLAFFVLEHVQGRAPRYGIVGSTMLVVAAIGASRLYLGVHYVSDVTAGFLAGGAWLGACTLAYQLARARKER
jgi:undecaprenyl-diphosphatase